MLRPKTKTVPAPQAPVEVNKPRTKAKSPAKSIDKSTLTHPEPRCIRERDHVRFVARALPRFYRD